MPGAAAAAATAVTAIAIARLDSSDCYVVTPFSNLAYFGLQPVLTK